ncbi:MAG TPA: hypothetical protein VM577_00705 [Anaerovoracaceae bacterium]|nr:hypothetical protein [Anaerovoracaceae bacterium]
MIFYFDRNLGSKDRERLESFEVEAEDFEAAIQILIKSQPQGKPERRGNNLFLFWKGADGREYFDNYFACLTCEPSVPIIEVPEQPDKEESK